MVAVLQPTKKQGKVIAIDRAVVLVGRGSDCDAIITDSQKISRRHCCLVQVDNTYYVRDLGSMNGIWVNGERVTRENLISTGDRVQIGDVEFLFHPNARIEQKKTLPSAPASQPAPVEDVLPVVEPVIIDEDESSLTIEEVADSSESDEIAEVAAQTPDNDDDIDLIESGKIKLIQVDEGIANDDAGVSDEFEIIDDVIPLKDDNDALLLETNEVEIIDEPLIEDEIIDVSGEDDDEIIPLED